MIRNLRSRVYYITPAKALPQGELVHLVEAVVAAGVGAVQYRAKDRATATMVQEAQALVRLTRRAQVPFIVNDRTDVALAVSADGVHVGQDDMPASYVRRMMGPYAIVGVTAPGPSLGRQAEQAGATYVSCGPIFPSPTKPDKSAIGPEAIPPVQNAVSLPVCAIGGINEETIHYLTEVTPAMVAVCSAINDAPDPGRAARRIVQLTEQVIPHIAFGV